MTPELIGMLIACLNFLGLVYVVIFRMSRTESRVEILWLFFMRRGLSEAIDKGVLEKNSPIHIPARYQERYRILLAKVKDFYDREGSRLSDMDLAMKIEALYWRDIRPVCLDAGVHDGACIAMMLNHVRPGAALFKEYEPIVWDDFSPSAPSAMDAKG